MNVLVSLPFEIIVWEDSDFRMGEKLTDEPIINVTSGWFVRETKRLVILMHEATHAGNFMTDNMDFTRIIKRNILYRHKVGDLPVLFALPINGGPRKRKTKIVAGGTMEVGAESEVHPPSSGTPRPATS